MINVLEMRDSEAQAINGGRSRGLDLSARGKYAVAAAKLRDVFQDSTVQTVIINGGKLTANDYGVIGIYNA